MLSQIASSVSRMLSSHSVGTLTSWFSNTLTASGYASKMLLTVVSCVINIVLSSVANSREAVFCFNRLGKKNRVLFMYVRAQITVEVLKPTKKRSPAHASMFWWHVLIGEFA